MPCIDVRVAAHCNVPQSELRKIVRVVERALREAGYRVSVTPPYRNRREPGYRVYIRVYGAGAGTAQPQER